MGVSTSDKPTVHVPENAYLRARIKVEGVPRLLFYVPSSIKGDRPYLFACGDDGSHPSCECAYRHPKRDGAICALTERSKDVAARAKYTWKEMPSTGATQSQ